MTPESSQTKVTIIFFNRAFYLGFVKRSALIIAVFALFASAEIYMHWYAGTRDTPTAHSLKDWYLCTEFPHGKPYHPNRLDADYSFPATALGFIVGLILARSSIWIIELVPWALFYSAGILALFPIYQKFFSELKMELPQLNTALSLIFGAIHCGFFMVVGRVLTRGILDQRSRKKVSPGDDIVI